MSGPEVTAAVAKPRYSETERMNLIANAVFAGWEFVPLSVRYGAAQAAESIVQSWQNARDDVRSRDDG